MAYKQGVPILNIRTSRVTLADDDNEHGSHTGFNDGFNNEQLITLEWDDPGDNVNYWVGRRRDGEDWQPFNGEDNYYHQVDVGKNYYHDIIVGELEPCRDENGNEIKDEDNNVIQQISEEGWATLKANYVYCVFKENDKSTENIYNYEVYVTANVIPPESCTEFTVKNTSRSVNVSWTDSIDTTWSKSVLVRKLIIDDTTTEPINSYDGVKLVTTSLTGKADIEITTEDEDGNKVTEIKTFDEKPKDYYKENSYQDKTASPFKYYYYTLFTIDIYGNETASESLTGGILDVIAPNAAKFSDEYESGLTVNLDSGIELYWNLPNDDDIAGVKLVRVEIAQDDEKYIALDPYRFAPDKPNDGITIYEGLGNYYADKTAINGVKYCYKLFPYDKSGNYNTKSDSVIKSLDCEYRVESMKIIPRYFDQEEVHYKGKPITIDKDYNQFGFEIRCNVGDGANIPLYIVRTTDDYDNITSEDELLGELTIVDVENEDGEIHQEYRYLIDPRYVKYKPSIDVEQNSDGTFDVIFYDFNANAEDWNKAIEDNVVYYYTSYILTHTTDVDNNTIPVYYRQELDCFRKIDFAIYDASTTNLYMKKFNTYFNSYNTNWEYGSSLTDNKKLLPYFTSNTTNATLSLRTSQENRNNLIENIKFISFNCEYSGWISYGYMDIDRSFSTDNDYVQLYNQSFRQLQTELNDYNMYKYLTKCFYIENENTEDNYIPAVRVDKNSKLMIDSVVLSYVSYDPSLEGETDDSDISNGNGLYTVIEIINDPLGNNTTSINKDTILIVNRLVGYDIEKIVIGSTTIDGSKIKQGESYVFHFCLSIEDETKHEDDDNWLKMGTYQMRIFGSGYSFEGSNYKFQGIKLQSKNIYTYNSMFKNCINLTKMPALYQGVTDYSNMFENCINLSWDENNVPTIPRRATNLSRMFCGCPGIIMPPALPYNAENCSEMFKECISLKYVPDFMTTFVTNNSGTRTNLKNISGMFNGCNANIKLQNIAAVEQIFGNCNDPANTEKKSDIFKNVTVDGCFRGCTDIIDTYKLTKTKWV